MTLIVVIALIVAVVGVVGAVSLARSSKADYLAANEVVAGVPTKAPPAWAGAHSPEARLHRRLRDAARALAANPRTATAELAPVRSSLEREALAIDERLVAVAALPERVRAEPLAAVEAAVASFEEAVAGVATSATQGALTVGDDEIRNAHDRLRAVEEARAEVERLANP